MRNTKLSSHALMIGLAFAYVAPGAFGQLNKSDFSNQKIIAERTNEVGVKTVIAVDQNDTVHEIEFGLQGTKGPTITANLGTRTARSGDVDLSVILPKDKVVTAARRVTLSDGSRIHALVVWGFLSFPDLSAPYCSLYILKEQHGKVDNLLSGENPGTAFGQFLVEDFSRDGKYEILFATKENAAASMSVHQIQPNGQIRKLQRIDGYYVHTMSDSWMDEDVQVYVEHKSENSNCDGVCYKTEAYTWSKTANKFVKTSP